MKSSLPAEETRTVCVTFFLNSELASFKKNTTGRTVSYYYTDQSLTLTPQGKPSLVRDADKELPCNEF